MQSHWSSANDSANTSQASLALLLDFPIVVIPNVLIL